MEKENLIHRTKDKIRNSNLERANPRHRKIRVTIILTKTPKSGASSTTDLGTTLMNVAQNNHWWLSSKKENHNMTWAMIQSTIKVNISSMYNSFLPSWPQTYNQKN
jgi:hypothetical protein